MTKPQTTRDKLTAELALHTKHGRSGDVTALLILVGQMLLEFHAETTAQLNHIHQLEQRIMSAIDDIKAGFAAQDAKIDDIGVKVDALEAAIAASAASNDAAVAAALADVKTAQDEAATHIDTLGAKFPPAA